MGGMTDSQPKNAFRIRVFGNAEIAALFSLLAILPSGPVTVASPPQGEGIVTGIVEHDSVRRSPTVIFINEMPGRKFEPPADVPVIDQRRLVFYPRVLPILVGTTVEFLNSDDLLHNVYSPEGGYDLGYWGLGGRKRHRFTQPGVYAQLCHVHPDMIAYVVVLKTPFFAVADGEGKFSLSNLPIGTWRIQVWNERFRDKQLGKSFPVTIVPGRPGRVEIRF